MTFNFLGPGLTVNVEAKVQEQIILDSSDLKRKILLQLSFVIEGADRIWLELTDYGFGQESLWINIRRSKHGSRVVASTP